MPNKLDLHVYIHWPYCSSICPYCDFNSFLLKNLDEKNILLSYSKEISFYANKVSKTHNVKTIFFGGGTPSLMNPILIKEIISQIKSSFDCSNLKEITIEANPTSSTEKKFHSFIQSGINRISIGIQSFDNENLKKLGRKHNKNEAVIAINSAINSCNNISFDMMYGLQEQSFENWKNDLLFAIDNFDVKHISIYNLTIEQNTKFFLMEKRNQINLPKSEIIDQMHDFTINTLAKNNFIRYEISNYAKNGFQSIHNLAYWQIKDYLGIGAGAHGRITINQNRYETENYHLPKKWIDSTLSNEFKIKKIEKISQQNQINEIFLMGMRTKDGINANEIKNRLGIDVFHFVNQNNLNLLKKQNLINFDDNKICLTYDGLSFANRIVEMLLQK